MPPTPRLIVLSGPSGVGKGTVCRQLLETVTFPLVVSRSATTRTPRVGEVHGVDYDFLDAAAFQALIDQDALLEWAEYNGRCYGTPAAFVDAALAQGQSVILEIEVQGALQVKTRRPDALLCFLEPPSLDELERRLRGRGTEDDEAIRRRLEIAQWELAQAPQFDCRLVNHRVEQAVQDLLDRLTQ